MKVINDIIKEIKSGKVELIEYRIKTLIEATKMIKENSELNRKSYKELMLDFGKLKASIDNVPEIRDHHQILNILDETEFYVQKNAITLATWLESYPLVKSVYYPGLPSHPGYDIMKKQARGFGSMVTFEVESKDLVVKILGNVKLIRFAESLGGVESLITYPITQTHADVPPAELATNGVTDTILRLSVGLESVDDLIYDLSQAFH